MAMSVATWLSERFESLWPLKKSPGLYTRSLSNSARRIVSGSNFLSTSFKTSGSSGHSTFTLWVSMTLRTERSVTVSEPRPHWACVQTSSNGSTSMGQLRGSESEPFTITPDLVSSPDTKWGLGMSSRDSSTSRIFWETQRSPNRGFGRHRLDINASARVELHVAMQRDGSCEADWGVRVGVMELSKHPPCLWTASLDTPGDERKNIMAQCRSHTCWNPACLPTLAQTSATWRDNAFSNNTTKYYERHESSLTDCKQQVRYDTTEQPMTRMHGWANKRAK